MKEKRSREQQNTSALDIPDIEIIDLEAEDNPSFDNSKRFDAGSKKAAGLQADSFSKNDDDFDSDKDFFPENPAPKKLRFRVNIHIVLIITFLLVIFAVVYKFFNWGVRIDLDEIFKDGQGTYEDTLDSILPLIGGTEEGPVDDGVTTIVAFGNAPFADDRDSADSLCAIIEDMTGASIYNCSVSGSYLAALSPQLDSQNHPMDAFNFYWLSTLAVGGPIDYFYDEARQAMGSDYPAEGDEVYNTLKNLDFDTVDVIAIMYDASDYLAGHAMYSDQNATDIQQFTGNLEAGLSLLQSSFPNARVIVMSPAYAFAIDEETGEYVSSDMYTYGGRDVLSTYVIKQYASAATRSVSFVDNLYGTITEDNAEEYLIDNLHLNKEGRKKVAERFVYALNYFN